jgi:serine/threonine protein kinase
VALPRITHWDMVATGVSRLALAVCHGAYVPPGSRDTQQSPDFIVPSHAPCCGRLPDVAELGELCAQSVRVPALGKARTCALQELALAQELHHPCIVATKVRHNPIRPVVAISSRRVPASARPSKLTGTTREDERVSRAATRGELVVSARDERGPSQETCVDGDTHTAHIVQEHCTGGTLKGWLSEAAATPSEATVLGWLAQLALALEYLHAVHRTIHRDVKSSNVFLQPPPPRPSSSSAARTPLVKLGALAWPLSDTFATTPHLPLSRLCVCASHKFSHHIGLPMPALPETSRGDANAQLVSNSCGEMMASTRIYWKPFKIDKGTIATPRRRLWQRQSDVLCGATDGDIRGHALLHGAGAFPQPVVRHKMRHLGAWLRTLRAPLHDQLVPVSTSFLSPSPSHRRCAGVCNIHASMQPPPNSLLQRLRYQLLLPPRKTCLYSILLRVQTPLLRDNTQHEVRVNVSPSLTGTGH